MKYVMILLMGFMMMGGFVSSGYASDWDKAGKILTGIEGLRILSGGRIDIVGGLTGINRQSDHTRFERSGQYYGPHYRNSCERVWVPEYTWRRQWVPAHREYDRRGGYRFVEGHYVEYKVANGGHWEYQCREYGHHRYRHYSR